MPKMQAERNHHGRYHALWRRAAGSQSCCTPSKIRDVGSGTPPWGALWVLALGLAMIVLDSSIVNVSIPAIVGDIGIDLVDDQRVT